MLTMSENPGFTPSSLYASAEYGRAVAEEEGGSWEMIHDSNGNWQLPLVLRHIPQTPFLDAATPYGYGGLHIGEDLSEAEAAACWRETTAILRSRGVVSVFLRFPPFLPHQAERASTLEGLKVLHVSRTILVPTAAAETMWNAMGRSSRGKIRVAQKAGCSVEVVAASPAAIGEARALYEQTMDRVGAAPYYYFSDNYYSNLSQLADRLHIARVVDSTGTCVSASFVLSDAEFAHYHLSGSSGKISGVVNLLLWGVFQWAEEAGLKAVHLGGGLTDGDSLYKFKASLGGHAETFSLGRSILSEDVYETLVAQHANELGVSPAELKESSFFPAYRVAAPPGGPRQDTDDSSAS